jgi:hypothetical protein
LARVDFLKTQGDAAPDNKVPDNDLSRARWWVRCVGGWCVSWNGTKESPLGNPQSRGLATWFVIPPELSAAVRKAIETLKSESANDREVMTAASLETRQTKVARRLARRIKRWE